MFEEMDDGGQYNIDCRLSAERNLEENVSAMIDFAYSARKAEVGVTRVKNRHEGYGFVADKYVAVQRAMKTVKDGMGDLLNSLHVGDSDAVGKADSVLNALQDAIVAAVGMAAEARRMSVDIYKEVWSPQAADDGFEEPEE